MGVVYLVTILSHPLVLSSRNAWKEVTRKESCFKDAGEVYCFNIKNHLVLIFCVNWHLYLSD